MAWVIAIKLNGQTNRCEVGENGLATAPGEAIGLTTFEANYRDLWCGSAVQKCMVGRVTERPSAALRFCLPCPADLRKQLP